MELYDIIKKAYILDPNCKFYYTFQSTPHKHDDFEIALVLDDDFEYSINNDIVTLNKGDGIFINSNVSHSLRPLNHNTMSKLFTIRFTSRFIVQDQNPDIYYKYIAPVKQNLTLHYLPLTISDETENEILYKLRAIKNSYAKNDPMMELHVQVHLCNIWELLLKLITSDDVLPVLTQEAIHDARLTSMLTYIHENIANPISIDDLMESSHITRDTCFKLFKEHFNCSPIKYINNYRIQEAIHLIETTDKSITEVCFDCGFNSQSYFGKKFKEATNMSASSYRKHRSSKDSEHL